VDLEEIFLAGGDAPAHEEVAQPDKKNNVHQILGGEGIDKMLGRLVENEDSRASGKNEGEKNDEDDTGEGGQENRPRASRLRPERI